MSEITPSEQPPNGASDSPKAKAGPLPQPAQGEQIGEPETVPPSDGEAPAPRAKDDPYPTRMSEAPFDMAAWAQLNGWPTVPGYEILGVLGRGGMGVVYQARQLGLGRLVALKMILAGAHSGPEEVARFRREAEAAARLQHPHIVQIHEIGEHAGLPYFSMEYVAGGSLGQKLAGTLLPPREAARLVETLARTVHGAHQRGIIHRDLKPGNILLTGDGTPKVADFGLAKRLDDAAGQTATGTIVGTPSYMAPEQAGGKQRRVGPAADVYALGAILYDLLTGRPPFKAASSMETVYQVLHQEPVPPRQLQPKLPRDLETICLKCLQKDSGQRYATAEALADDLCRFREGKPIAARPVGVLGRTWRWSRRNPAVASLLAAVAGSLLVGAGVATYFAVQATSWAAEYRRERDCADHEADSARRRLYQADLRLAQQAWEDAQINRLQELLDGQRPEHTGGQDLRGFEWYYWQTFGPNDLRTFRGHTGRVTAVAFRPDGKHLASASLDGTVRVWEVESGREVLALRGHTDDVRGVAYSPDGRRLASTSADQTVRLWAADSGRELRVFKGHRNVVTGVAFSPDGRRLAIGSSDETVRVWEVDSGGELRALKGHTNAVFGVAFSPDGKRLASASADETVRLWDLDTGREMLAFKGHTSIVWDVAFSPDGRRVASTSNDKTARLWEADTGREVLAFKGHAGGVDGVAFSPDGRRLASAGRDNTVRIWEADRGREVLAIRGANKTVAFSPDGERLASASEDGTVRLWDADPGRVEFTLLGHTGQVWGVTFSPDGRYLASNSGDGTVRLWAVASGMPVRSLQSGIANRVAFSPDGQRLAAGDAEGTLKIWETQSGRLVRECKGHSDWVEGLAFSPDGRRLASAAGDRTLRVWELPSGRELLALKGHTGGLTGVAFSPDGRRLASASFDGTVRLWEADSGQVLHTLKGHTGAVRGVAFNPDGRRLASASHDQTVRLWEADSGRELLTLKGHARGVFGVAFSPDGRRLASASGDTTVRLWDVDSGRELLSLKGHTDAVAQVAFSPDGQRLASASYDQTVRVWEAVPVERPRRRQREVVRLVGSLASQYLLPDEVTAQIQGDQSLSEPVRQQALALVKDWPEPAPASLDAASWAVVREPHAAAGRYRLALRWAQEACRRQPENASYVFTLGVAQYRHGNYAEALTSLTQAESRRAKEDPDSIPGFLAFMAMAHQQLGHREEAAGFLAQLRRALRDPRRANLPGHQGFRQEAEALIEGKPGDGKMPYAIP